VDDGLKQRLVGAVVLSAVAILFVPVLFDQPDSHKVDTTTQIPAQPDVRPKTVASATRPEGIVPASDARVMFEPSPVTDVNGGVSATPKSKTLINQSEPKGSLSANAKPAAITLVKPIVAKPQVAKTQKVKTQKVKTKPTRASANATKPSVKRSPSPAVLDGKGLPNAWVIQVVSSGSVEKAGELVAKLKSKRYKAYYRSVKTPKGVVYRVFVGPKISRSQASKLKLELDKLLNVNALILRFQP